MLQFQGNGHNKNTNLLRYLDYIWISKFRGIERQGFHFLRKYRYEYNDKKQELTRTLNEESEKYIDSFFGDNIEVSAVIGKNGCGKTSLLQAVFACLDRENRKPKEQRILLVFRDGTVYTNNNSVQKFEDNQTELIVNWSSEKQKMELDLRCCYHTNVMDYQSLDFCNSYDFYMTNISTTSLLTNYINSVFIDDKKYDKGNEFNANELLKGFFFIEFEKQITLFKELTEKGIKNFDLHIPNHAYIRLKSEKTLISDFELRFNIENNNEFEPDLKELLLYLYNDRVKSKQRNKDIPYEQFKAKLSLCILSDLLYATCSKIEMSLINDIKKSKFNSSFAANKSYKIVLYILRSGLNYAKRLLNRKLYDSWNIVCELLNILTEESSKYIRIRENIRKNVRTFYSENNISSDDKVLKNDMFSLEDNTIFTEQLDNEILGTLNLLREKAYSLNDLVKYISEKNDTVKNMVFSESEDVFLIDISENKSKNSPNNSIIDLKELWNYYRTIGMIYDFMNISWNLSSGEYARWTMFARIYYHAEEINLKLNTKPHNLLLLFDEADMLLHPEWQRSFVDHMVTFVKKMYSDIQVQIIIATHSPIMLSDIPKQNTLYLETGEIRSNAGNETFAANIFSLYQDSFFIKDTGIGSFAKKKLIELVKDIHEGNEHERKYSNAELLKQIDSIGDVFLHSKLKKEFFLYRFSSENEKEKSELTLLRTELRKKDEELKKAMNELENLRREKKETTDNAEAESDDKD